MTGEETREWLWLAHVLGPCNPRSLDVMRTFEAPRMLKQHIADAVRLHLLTPVAAEAAKSLLFEDMTGVENQCKELGVAVLAFNQPEYPDALRELDSAPPVLYVKGDVSVLKAPLIFGIIGTRRPSAYGIEATRAIAKPLAEAGAVLVSGLASGLDGEAHKAALAAQIPTIACIAYGHDHCYPAEHRTLKRLIEQTGAVVGEYPPGTRPMRHQFLQRNRLIAGLARGICVAEARQKSGTMNTVSSAIEFGRDVFAVPGSIFSPLCEGTNDLIKNGAAAVTCAQDILTWYGLSERAPEETAAKPEKSDASLSETARTVRKALNFAPQSCEQLCGKTGLAPRAVLSALTELELEGFAEQKAGRLFCLPTE